jgi:hypothetical protein
MQKLSLAADPFKIVVIGGSMTAGTIDFPHMIIKEIAWPHKLLNFMNHKWSNPSIEIINLATGGANEDYWIKNIDTVLDQEPIDVILVESALNDQCAFHQQASKEQYVNRTSNSLLNILMNFPSKPAVISVELFRTAYDNYGDAKSHCLNNVRETMDPALNQSCYFCEQWWMPQDWRVSARERNSVSYISYRDGVWPDQHHPPNELCQYWSGLAHPKAGAHAMVASTVLFTFLLVDHKRDAMVKKFHELEQSIKIEPISADLGVCLHPVSSFRAIQGDPRDPMDTLSINSDKPSCWEFRADSKEKYGWICEVNRTSPLSNVNGQPLAPDSLDMQKYVTIGKKKLVIVSHLLSYDKTMARAAIWFSGLGSNNTSNVFVGNPVWYVNSYHPERTSVPEPFSIFLETYELKSSTGLQWEESFDLELFINIKVLIGSFNSIYVDKFKLLGIVAC